MVEQPTLRQLAIFAATVRNGSAGRAAQELGLSQPAITHALAKLERGIGTPLLRRGPGGSASTDAGQILYRRVTRLWQQIEAAILADRPDDGRLPGRLNSITSTQVACHIAIAERGSFRAGARALHISEPALHRTAREFERLIGIPLYRRQLQHISVTPEGERLARRLQVALHEIDQAIDEIEFDNGLANGRLALGTLPLMPKPLLARALGQLLARFPAVAVTLEEGSYDNLTAAMRRGRIDMVLGSLRETPEDIDIAQEPLFDDPYVVIAHHGHELAGKRPPSLGDLASQSWVVPTIGTPRRTVLERLFAILPVRPRIVLETNSVAMMIAMLTESDCLTLGSRAQAMIDFQGEDLALLPMPISSRRPIGITSRADWLPTRVQQAFLEIVRTIHPG